MERRADERGEALDCFELQNVGQSGDSAAGADLDSGMLARISRSGSRFPGRGLFPRVRGRARAGGGPPARSPRRELEWIVGFPAAVGRTLGRPSKRSRLKIVRSGPCSAIKFRRAWDRRASRGRRRSHSRFDRARASAPAESQVAQAGIDDQAKAERDEIVVERESPGGCRRWHRDRRDRSASPRVSRRAAASSSGSEVACKMLRTG